MIRCNFGLKIIQTEIVFAVIFGDVLGFQTIWDESHIF